MLLSLIARIVCVLLQRQRFSVLLERLVLQIRWISNLAKTLSISGVWQVATLGPFRKQARFKIEPNLVSSPKAKAQVLRTRLERVVGDPEPHHVTVHLL